MQDWLESPGQGSERIHADVHRQVKPPPAGVVIRTAEFFAVGEGDGVHQDIDLSKDLCSALGDLLDLVILRHVTWFDESTADRISQWAHAPFQDFASVAQAQ